MTPIRILVAEDDASLRQGLVDLLEDEGYQALAAADGESALRLYAEQRPNLLLLDVMMPGKSGFEMCRAVRQKDRETPIILLTAKGEEIDKVVGLELGADDYITKPFGLHELRARIKVQLRRISKPCPESIPDPFRFGKALIERHRMQGSLQGSSFRLSVRELKLLEMFYLHAGEVLSRDTLLNHAWGIDYQGTTRTLDQHIVQLRKKVEECPDQPKAIQTAHGIGYRYAGAEQDR